MDYKPEVIAIGDDSNAACVFAMNSIGELDEETFTKILDRSREIEQTDKRHVHVHVEAVLLINGVQVPFVDTLKRYDNQIDKAIDTLAQRKALEMVTLAGLKDLVDLGENVKYQIIDLMRSKGVKITLDS
jgi:hypothetical protein